jgi:anti-sigma B factor antagonist
MAVADLDVRVERQDGQVHLALSGELDLATVGALHEAVAEQLAAGPVGDLVLDLTGITFLDSSGLGALLQVRSAVQSAGGELRISAVAPGPARVIAIAGLSGTFGIGG